MPRKVYGGVDAAGNKLVNVADGTLASDAITKAQLDGHTHPTNTSGIWNYGTSLVMADPGSGNVRTNTAAVVDATQIAISRTTQGGVSAADILGGLAKGDIINAQLKADSTNWVRFTVDAAPTNNTTWFLIPVKFSASQGPAIAKNSDLLISFTTGAGGGGSQVVNEVSIQTAQPVDATEIWIDTDEDSMVGLDGRYILRSGDTMSGKLLVPAATADTEAVNLGQVKTQFGRRNRIINGDFGVAQRAVASGSAVGVNLFLHDRWFATASTGTCTYTLVTAAVGELPESASSFARIAASGQDASTGFAQLIQKIESVRTLSNKQVTVSFWAKAAAGAPKVWVQFSQVFGTGGSPSATVNIPAGSVTLSTTWARYSLTVTLPSIAGKTLGSSNDTLELHFWTSAGTSYSAYVGAGSSMQAATIDFWGVQVEEGPVATNFEHMSYAETLRLCQRYFVRFGSGEYIACGNNWSTANALIPVPVPVRLRVAPSLAYSAIGHLNILTGGTNIAATSAGVGAFGAITQVINFNASGMTAGYAAVLWISSGGYLDFSAEL